MSIDGISAISDVASKVRGAESAAETAGDGGSFSEALGKLASGVSEALKFGEATAIAGLTGGAPPLAVVSAVVNAQHTLQAALAVRDKAVSAYQEISRMAI